MDDDNTQQSKKTVVAFVAGLIIGGLLVWLFWGVPQAAAPDKMEKDDIATTATKKTDEEMVNKTDDTKMATEPSMNNFTFSVANQDAGKVVELGGNVKYPTKEGWIVVQHDVDGELGTALGAARYDTAVGLTPSEVELVVATEAGKKYHVVYYSESGDKKFDRKEDRPLMKDGGGVIEATFMAE